MSEPINELATALAKAQAELQNPKFDSVNPHLKNKFASLAAVRTAIVPVFAKHGLSIIQDLTAADASVLCTTILLHSSGQSTRVGPLPIPVSKADAQGYGSAATYARRYALLGIAGVSGEPDDDGNAAVDRPAPEYISEKQTEELRALIKTSGETEDRFMKWARIQTLGKLPASAFTNAKKKLEAKRSGPALK
jgi:hypothetical protein